jgi:hypothetical protein
VKCEVWHLAYNTHPPPDEKQRVLNTKPTENNRPPIGFALQSITFNLVSKGLSHEINNSMWIFLFYFYANPYSQDLQNLFRWFFVDKRTLSESRS